MTLAACHVVPTCSVPIVNCTTYWHTSDLLYFLRYCTNMASASHHTVPTCTVSIVNCMYLADISFPLHAYLLAEFQLQTYCTSQDISDDGCCHYCITVQSSCNNTTQIEDRQQSPTILYLSVKFQLHIYCTF